MSTELKKIIQCSEKLSSVTVNVYFAALKQKSKFWKFLFKKPEIFRKSIEKLYVNSQSAGLNWYGGMEEEGEGDTCC